jgi:hypothetical protein
MSEVVSIPFFYNDHWSLDVQRGPYKHSRDWLAAQLEFALHDAENTSDWEDSDDEDDANDDKSPSLPSTSQDDSDSDWEDTDSEITESDSSISNDNDPTTSSDTVTKDEPDSESREAIKARIHRLQALIPTIFPASDKETYVLYHQDLSSNNILVSSTHALTGIIDWECVHTVPLYLACQIPKFLLGRARSSPPHFESEFENEWYEKGYYDDIEEYEKTQLREFFLEEMARVCPEWVECYEESGLKADFEFAVCVVTQMGCGEDIDEWIKAVEDGEEPCDLREALGQC